MQTRWECSYSYRPRKLDFVVMSMAKQGSENEVYPLENFAMIPTDARSCETRTKSSSLTDSTGPKGCEVSEDNQGLWVARAPHKGAWNVLGV